MSKIDYSAVLQSLSQAVKDAPTIREATIEDVKPKAGEMQKRGYVFAEHSLEALRLYLSGYGLILHGNVGTGKTLFFKLLHADVMKVGWGSIDKRLKIFSMAQTAGLGMADIAKQMDEMRGDEVMIDDIGVEPTFNNYGVKFDVLGYIVDCRMDCGKRTHFTTNLTMNEIRDRYGDRVIDRLTELCKAVQFSGQSMRFPRQFCLSPEEEAKRELRRKGLI